MDQSKTPPTHLGSCRYLNFAPRGFGFVHHSIAILYHEVPNPYLTIRNFFIAVSRPNRPDSHATHQCTADGQMRRTVEANGMTTAVHIRLMVTRGLKSTPYQNPTLTVGRPTVVRSLA